MSGFSKNSSEILKLSPVFNSAIFISFSRFHLSLLILCSSCYLLHFLTQKFCKIFLSDLQNRPNWDSVEARVPSLACVSRAVGVLPYLLSRGLRGGTPASRHSPSASISLTHCIMGGLLLPSALSSSESDILRNGVLRISRSVALLTCHVGNGFQNQWSENSP